MAQLLLPGSGQECNFQNCGVGVRPNTCFLSSRQEYVMFRIGVWDGGNYNEVVRINKDPWASLPQTKKCSTVSDPRKCAG